MKKARYHEMLRSDIWQFVSRSNCKTFEDMIARARQREIDLEMERKRKPDSAVSVEGSSKRTKVSDYRPKGQHGRSRCGRCDKVHEGTRRAGGSGCFKCCRTGHISIDCTTTTPVTPVSDLICFQCNHKGHKKAHCLSLATAGPMLTPAHATLRITDNRQGRADAPAVKSRAFQPTAKEARAAPDVLMGMYLLLISLFILNCCLCFCVSF